MGVRVIVPILTLALGLLAAPMPAEAQKAGKVHRIGWLGPKPLARPFLGELRARGWVEGEHFVMEYRPPQKTSDPLPKLAEQLARLKVDVIVAIGNPAIAAAKQATTTIPVCSCFTADPVVSGLVDSLGRPGGNLTGVTLTAGPEMIMKSLELLREAVPGVSRVGVLHNPDNRAHLQQMAYLDTAAKSLGVDVVPGGARKLDELSPAFKAMASERAGALVVLPDHVFTGGREQLADLAVTNRMPAISFFRKYVDAGGLMSYAANFGELFRQLARYVDQILKGADPSKLPVQRPMAYELVVNMKTAKALGLTIPPSVLVRADKIIE